MEQFIGCDAHKNFSVFVCEPCGETTYPCGERRAASRKRQNWWRYPPVPAPTCLGGYVTMWNQNSFMVRMAVKYSSCDLASLAASRSCR